VRLKGALTRQPAVQRHGGALGFGFSFISSVAEWKTRARRHNGSSARAVTSKVESRNGERARETGRAIKIDDQDHPPGARQGRGESSSEGSIGFATRSKARGEAMMRGNLPRCLEEICTRVLRRLRLRSSPRAGIRVRLRVQQGRRAR